MPVVTLIPSNGSHRNPLRSLALRGLALGLLAALVAACGAPSPVTPDPSLTVTPNTIELGVGETETLQASLDGSPTTAVAWQSANAGVASVDTGVVTGVAAGETVVTATSTADPSVQAEASVTVAACEGPEQVDSDITVPTTWTAQGFDCTDYVVQSMIDVTDGLAIEAGTIVHFEEEAGLRVTSSSGSIEVAGTTDAQVRFAGTEQAAGWWRGIEMWRTGESNPSSMNYAIIEHAGHPGDAGDEGYSLQLGTPGTTDSSDVNVISVTNTVIRDGGGYGLRATRFSELSDFANNTITAHADAPVWVSARNSGFLDAGSDLTGNGDDFVLVEANESISATAQTHDITEALTWTRLASDVPYRFDGVAKVTAALTVAAGVTVEFVEDGELRVTDGGSIVADGTSAAPITFTGTEAVRGHWRGIVVWRPDEDAQSLFDHVTIEYGGRTATDFPEEVYGFNLAIGSPTSDPSATSLDTTLTNSTLRQSAGHGLYISSQSTFLPDGFADNTLTANAEGAAHVSAEAARWLDNATSYDGNDDDRVFLDARDSPWDNVVSNATWPVLGDGVRYEVDGVIDLRAVLTLEPGVTLSFQEDTGIFAQDEAAGIVAEGTEADRIVFTGDTPVAGSWYGIYLREARMADNVMDFVTIEYGGGEFDGGVTGWVSNEEFNLSVGQIPSNTAQMLITNTEFRNAGVSGSGSGYGLYVGEGSLVNADACGANTFSDTQQGCLIDD